MLPPCFFAFALSLADTIFAMIAYAIIYAAMLMLIFHVSILRCCAAAPLRCAAACRFIDTRHAACRAMLQRASAIATLLLFALSLLFDAAAADAAFIHAFCFIMLIRLLMLMRAGHYACHAACHDILRYATL